MNRSAQGSIGIPTAWGVAALLFALPVIASAASLETLSHTLNLSPEQKAKVEIILNEEFQARRALRADGQRPSCKQRRKVWDATRLEMAKVLDEDQLARYDQRQKKRMRSCARAASYKE